MKLSHVIITLIVIFSISACQPQDEPLPTLMRLPSMTPSPTLTPSPTVSPTASLTPTVTASATITPTATTTATPSPIVLENLDTPPASLTPAPTVTEAGNGIVIVSTVVRIVPTPVIERTPLPPSFIFGRSADGADLVAYRYGTGQKVIILVGGIHAGFEANTVRLVEELNTHYASNPREIQSNITLILVPTLNPDGLSYGRQIRGRFNGNNVDLNRNWDCGWSPNAVFANGAVDAGAAPFSEPESLALGSLIQRVQPSAVLFYHSAANGVFAGNCSDGSTASSDLARVYGTATGYPYGAEFSAYDVTGTAAAWVDSIGIPSADIELANSEISEFSRNLRGVNALQQWLIQMP